MITHDRPTLCRWCEADTHAMDFCPNCGRAARFGGRRPRDEEDAYEYMTRDRNLSVRLSEGYEMMDYEPQETDDENELHGAD